MSSSSSTTRSSQRDSRHGGVTALGLFLIEAAALGVLALLLGWLNNGLGLVFQLAFVGVAVVGALRVRRRDLIAGFIVPPLAYAAAIVIASPSLGIGNNAAIGIGSNLASLLAVGAPWLFLGTLVAFVLCVWRGRTGR